MPIAIQPFSPGHARAVSDFNRRLAAAGQDWQFPDAPEPAWLARANGGATFQEFFVAADGDAVRGAYALQHRPAAIDGEPLSVGTWYLPISEGLIDPRYALVAMLMTRDALRRAPVSFCLGMNGVDSPVAKLGARLGCEPWLVPFFARIENGTRFAREARYLRSRRGMAPLLDVAAATGAASLGAGLLRLALQRTRRLPGDVRVEAIEEFGPWADLLWERCAPHYSFVELRDADTLNRVYPKGRPHLSRLRLLRGSETLGWAVLQATRMSDNQNFGALYVGRITDVFAAPEDAEPVMQAATEALSALGVDLLLSNQSHPAWCTALRRQAFLPVPSNFAFAASPELAERIGAVDPENARLHLNRGDGDGPWGHDPRAF
ncbi:MAG: hypothetical protein ABFS41_00110 [Myxococcota bacterium]